MKTATSVPPQAESLVSASRPVASLRADEIAAMWALYERYYDGTSEAIFRRDLARKTDVILSRDAAGAIRGFSTVEVARHSFRGEEMAILFSGDTIVDHRYWARNDFAFAWIRFAASVKRRSPETPLYWLLIVKGHRTYRYLKVFAHRYYPSPSWETPDAARDLMDDLAARRFGTAWDPASGLLRFEESQGHLKEPWAAVPERARRLPEVAFFLRRNPGYVRGDELVCLCEVSEANMRRVTRRIFEEAMRERDPMGSG